VLQVCRNTSHLRLPFILQFWFN